MNILIQIPEPEIEQDIQILTLTKLLKTPIQEIHPMSEIMSLEINQIKIINQTLELEVISQLQYLKIQETKLIRITFEEMNLIIKL
jgi:hypothetical protein